ncbi:hypothetical protein LCGC14_3084340 [marine sediment metagenome]|uniref:Uncharacterized protein n=1 Tax=marine sediment metagenome TaxID=412755 RepID=A0A0F8Z332_9ZZZZ
MKKEITKTVEFCDACEKQCDYPRHCMKCGRAFCYECSKKYGVEYPHAVHFSGSDDGFYCMSCDEELRKIPDRSKATQIHQAYLGISSLRLEYKRLYAELEIREKEVETKLKNLIG